MFQHILHNSPLFYSNPKPRHGNGHKKWKKKIENQILKIHWWLSVCSSDLLSYSLWEYSTHRKHREGDSGRGGVRGRFSRPSGRRLCRLCLIGLSFCIFQVRLPFDHEEDLSNNEHAWEPGGGLFMHLCFTSIHHFTRRQKDTLLHGNSHANLQSIADRSLISVKSLQTRCNCHSE